MPTTIPTHGITNTHTMPITNSAMPRPIKT
jgi:hypothetical protein